jgi:hypothetical protein
VTHLCIGVLGVCPSHVSNMLPCVCILYTAQQLLVWLCANSIDKMIKSKWIAKTRMSENKERKMRGGVGRMGTGSGPKWIDIGKWYCHCFELPTMCSCLTVDRITATPIYFQITTIIA